MAVVDAARLRRFMSNPRWSTEQEETVEALCAEVEDSLRFVLNNVPITPEQMVEVAPILDTGQVDTTYPVHQLQTVDGVPPDPTTWAVRSHRLHKLITPARLQGAGDAPSSITSPFVELGGLASTSFVDRATQSLGGSPYVGTVTVQYMGGWGPQPALVNAILRKAAAFMEYRHSDVVIATGLDGQAPPPPAPETWTADELMALGAFRRLSTGGTR